MTATPPIGRLVAYLVGVALLAFCITLLWLGMRGVMDLGGACASGGPYIPRVECPDAVIATTPLSIIGAFGAIGLMLWGGSALGGGWVGLAFLAWPALFISLGWNFVEFGFAPPSGGWVWSWLICGVLFIAMGVIPLIFVIGALRSADGDGRAYVGGRIHVRPDGSGRSGGAPGSTITLDASAPSVPDRGPSVADDDPLAVRLARLSDLRRQGHLTEAEFGAARSATLAAEAERPA
jgi:hypothetical protein